LTSNSFSAGVRLLVAGLAAAVLVSVGVPAPAWAAAPAQAAAAASSVEEPTNLATDEDKVEAARVLGINAGMDMLVLNDQAFVLSIWRQAKTDSFVKAEALRAYDSADTAAAYAFIKTGIFTAAADDAQAEIAAERAKALRRSVAVTVGLDPRETALIEQSDRDFIFSVWQRVDPVKDAHVRAAAQEAIKDGSTVADWAQFLATGAQEAHAQDVQDEIDRADAEQAARLRAEQLATAKRSLLQLLLIPVTEELVNAPNRQYVLHVHSTAKGTEVKLAAQAALNAPDAGLDKALSDFIFTGGAAANALDEQAAAAKELAGYRTQVIAIRDAAKLDGVQPNLTAAADRALTDNTLLALQTFLLKGQDEARALDRTRSEKTVNTLAVQSSNLCLAVGSAATTAGAHVLQWTCNGGAEQDWRIRSRGTGRYEIRNDNSNMCLAIGGGSKENAAHVLQWTCREATLDQTWQLNKDAKGNTQLRNVNSGQCLAIGGGAKENGEHAIQWPCNTARPAEQSWNVKPRTAGKRIVNKLSNLCLSNGGFKDNGAHVLQTACDRANDAEWHLNPLAGGYTQIRNDRSNLCLAIGSGSKENGAHALQWTCRDATLDQSWQIVTGSGGVAEIRNANSGLCLAIGSGSKEDGAHALQWTCGGATHLEQAWLTVDN
jgi:hypothetical protein